MQPGVKVSLDSEIFEFRENSWVFEICIFSSLNYFISFENCDVMININTFAILFQVELTFTLLEVVFVYIMWMINNLVAKPG